MCKLQRDNHLPSPIRQWHRETLRETKQKAKQQATVNAGGYNKVEMTGVSVPGEMSYPTSAMRSAQSHAHR
jgi:6,7-dimethyl-8-ribityllumazine synthase